uniref:Uncharacterized protein n=1 Tax=Strix occidentalis caurina TaxID=311401 RepID=A0A8D0FZP4_STROC
MRRMSCDDGLRPFFYQYSTVSMLGNIVTLLLQMVYLTAIAVLVEKLSADQANTQHEKWVCTASVVSTSPQGELLLRGLLHSNDVIATPASAESTWKFNISRQGFNDPQPPCGFTLFRPVCNKLSLRLNSPPALWHVTSVMVKLGGWF